MYQALQNTIIGLGATCGACLGGVISDFLGWRFCFLFQVPVAATALVVGFLMVNNSHDHHAREPQSGLGNTQDIVSTWSRVDLSGAFSLVACLSLQTTALSVGSNGVSWTNPVTLLCFGTSLIFLLMFLRIESRTRAVPIMPLEMLRRTDRVSLLISNVGLGIAVYGVGKTAVTERMPQELTVYRSSS